MYKEVTLAEFEKGLEDEHSQEVNRQIQKNKKELPMKKVVARKMGLTTKELNKKYFKKNKEEK